MSFAGKKKESKKKKAAAQPKVESRRMKSLQSAKEALLYELAQVEAKLRQERSR